MSRLKVLWAAFLGSYEVRYIRSHAVLLTACGAIIALCVIAVVAAQ